MNSDFNWSLVISLCALLISVLSPVITACINNSHERKMKKLEFDQAHRIAALERYLRAAGAACGNGSSVNYSKYWESVSEAYLYIPVHLWPLIDEAGDALKIPDYDRAQDAIIKLSKELSEIEPIPSFDS